MDNEFDQDHYGEQYGNGADDNAPEKTSPGNNAFEAADDSEKTQSYLNNGDDDSTVQLPGNNYLHSDNNDFTAYGTNGGYGGNNQYGNTPYNNAYRNDSYRYGGEQGEPGQNDFRNDMYGSYQSPQTPQTPQKPQKKDKGTKVFIALIVIIVLLAVGLTVSLFLKDSGSDISQNQIGAEKESNESFEKKDTDNVDHITASDASLGAGEAAEVARVAKKFNVGILIYQNDSLYTEGSGVVMKEDNDGKYTYIVTCAHVVNHSNTAISVLMEDGTEYPAELVGFDTRTDLGVIRIEKSGLTAAEIASSDDLVVGQYVYAVGNPGGSEFFGSVSNGIISAIDRPISSSDTGYQMECIQHTAAINPGNSGGALVNGEGKLIGINSMKIASTEYEGMGFAVPSEVVMEVFNSIIESGYVTGRAKLGITYTTPSGYSQTYAMYVQMKGLPSGSIVIASVAEDSDLANYDVNVGDIITHVNGKEMTDSGMLSAMIEDMSAGDTLKLTIVSINTKDWSQSQKDITVKLVEDKGTSTLDSDDDSSDSSNNPFGGSGGSQDWYDFFKEYYGY